jgi:hypothetical protein
MSGSDYALELPGDYVTFVADNDAAAVRFARTELDQRQVVRRTGLKLFRYPLHYVSRPTKGLIEVPFYPGIPQLKFNVDRI